VASANNLIAGINPFPSTLLIGKDAYSFGVSSFEYFKGYMDDLSFFNRALTPCEVLRLAKGPKACANGQICSTGHLSASCSFSPNSALINETVTLTATTTGALGSTTFSWSGTSLTGKNTRIATTSYSIEGTYYASTTVSDGFSTTTVGCLSEIGSDQEIIITPLVYSGVCSLLTVDRCQVGTSTNSTHTENSYGTNYDWICLGSDPLRTTDDVPCHSFYPNSDAAFDCNVSMTNPSTGSVNINTNTTWTVTPKTSNPDWSTYDKDWTLSDHNNENIFIGSSESGSNTFDYIFNTVGLKTIGASVRGGNMCTSTVTIVQQGGHGREI
jgi:hypothetical protein